MYQCTYSPKMHHYFSAESPLKLKKIEDIHCWMDIIVAVPELTDSACAGVSCESCRIYEDLKPGCRITYRCVDYEQSQR